MCSTSLHDAAAGSVQPSLMSAVELAAMTGRSVRSIWRDNAAGRLPRPVRLGGAVRWRRNEIVEWIAAGCPNRETWDCMEESRHV
jgi:predicted DNA-binding transcriptional regulator AlpA